MNFIFERWFEARDREARGYLELGEWFELCREDLKMPRFLLKDWEVEMVFRHVDANESETLEAGKLAHFLDPERCQLGQDDASAKMLRRLAAQVRLKLPHRAFTAQGVDRKTTFVIGMPRVKAVFQQKDKRPLRLRRHHQLLRLGLAPT